MAKKSLKTYHVYAKLSVEAAVSVKAESLADALEQAGQLSDTDFVEFKDEFVDSDGVYIQGLFESTR